MSDSYRPPEDREMFVVAYGLTEAQATEQVMDEVFELATWIEPADEAPVPMPSLPNDAAGMQLAIDASTPAQLLRIIIGGTSAERAAAGHALEAAWKKHRAADIASLMQDQYAELDEESRDADAWRLAQKDAVAA